MKMVIYKSTNPYVGKFVCPQCQTVTKAWRSSGMSQCFPHFYCNKCSNAVQRDSDQALVYKNELSLELLNRIAETLPACSCGGKFSPGSDPKCPSCGFEFANSVDPVSRLTDPNVILINGACFFGDPEREPFQVIIS